MSAAAGTYNYGGYPPAPGGLALAVWQRRRRLALWAFLLAFAGFSAFALALPNLYKGTVTVLVQPKPVSETSDRPSTTPDDPDTRLQMINEQILSRDALEALIKRYNLYSGLRRSASSMQDAVEQMRKDVGLDLKQVDPARSWVPGSGAYAFAIHYQSVDPRLAVDVANNLAKNFVEENTKSREQQASGTADFLSSQLNDAKVRLEQQERRMAEFRASKTGDLPDEAAQSLGMLERLSSQIQMSSEQQSRLLERRDSLQKQLEALDPRAPASPEATADEMAKLHRELDDLRVKYKDNHPEVIRVRQRIDALARRLNGQAAAPSDMDPGGGGTPPPINPPKATSPPAGGSITRRLRDSISRSDADLRRMQQEQDNLRRQISAYQAGLTRAPQIEAQLKEITRDYDSAKDAYVTLLKRVEEARLRENFERLGDQFRILDKAVFTGRPVAPDRMRLLLGGLVAALAFAVGAAILAERRDTSFHSADDLRTFTRVPLLATIPRIATELDRRAARRRSVMTAVAGLAGVLVLIGAGEAAGHVAGSQIVTLFAGDKP
jgi:polysaccharide chain length determinant protein (PEP-CTERM system associated)